MPHLLRTAGAQCRVIVGNCSAQTEFCEIQVSAFPLRLGGHSPTTCRGPRSTCSPKWTATTCSSKTAGHRREQLDFAPDRSPQRAHLSISACRGAPARAGSSAPSRSRPAPRSRLAFPSRFMNRAVVVTVRRQFPRATRPRFSSARTHCPIAPPPRRPRLDDRHRSPRTRRVCAAAHGPR